MSKTHTSFKPGEVTNPRGRPKLTDAQRLAREMRQQAQPEVIETLVELLKGGEPKDRIAAAKALLIDLPVQVAQTDAEGNDVRTFETRTETIAALLEVRALGAKLKGG